MQETIKSGGIEDKTKGEKKKSHLTRVGSLASLNYSRKSFGLELTRSLSSFF